MPCHINTVLEAGYQIISRFLTYTTKEVKNGYIEIYISRLEIRNLQKFTTFHS